MFSAAYSRVFCQKVTSEFDISLLYGVSFIQLHTLSCCALTGYNTFTQEAASLLQNYSAWNINQTCDLKFVGGGGL